MILVKKMKNHMLSSNLFKNDKNMFLLKYTYLNLLNNEIKLFFEKMKKNYNTL